MNREYDDADGTFRPTHEERGAYEARLRAIPLAELRYAGFQADEYHESMRDLFIRALDPATTWERSDDEDDE